MPAKVITVKGKTKDELKKEAEKQIKKAAQNGFDYVKQGYSDSKVRKVKGGYEVEIEVHS